MNYQDLLGGSASGPIQVCSISLNMTDRIRLIGLTMDVTDSLRKVIADSWGPVQSERIYYGTHEFKVR